MTIANDKPLARQDPQCMAGSCESPGCKATQLQEQIAALNAELREVQGYKLDAEAVFLIDRKHQQTGPEHDCSCPSCELHHQYQAEIAALREQNAKLVEALTMAHEAMKHGNHYTMSDSGSEAFSKAQRAIKEALASTECK